MNQQQMLRSQIESLFTKITGDDAPAVETPFREIPTWDSLNHAEFIIGLQKQFGIRFTAKEIIAIDSLGRALEMVSSRMPSA